MPQHPASPDRSRTDPHRHRLESLIVRLSRVARQRESVPRARMAHRTGAGPPTTTAVLRVFFPAISCAQAARRTGRTHVARYVVRPADRTETGVCV